MAKSRTELFAEAFVRRRMERQTKEWISKYCAGMPVEDFRYAAEHNLNIISSFLKSGEQKSQRKKAAPFRHLIEGVTADDLIRLFDEVAPEHASVLRQYRQWFANQLEIVREDIFGKGE